MTKLRPTNDLYAALRAVASRQVVCHPAGSPHVPGWAWADGGDVGLAMQGVLTELYHARLIHVDRARLSHVGGDPVLVTGLGTERLSAWQFWASRAKAGGAA